MKSRLKAKWIDSGLSPQHAPDPRFPNGIAIPALHPDEANCSMQLPYPARRVGYYLVECQRCRLTVLVTTAGRPDDPRSVALNCNLRGLQ